LKLREQARRMIFVAARNDHSRSSVAFWRPFGGGLVAFWWTCFGFLVWS
jgi:hypothetical protein